MLKFIFLVIWKLSSIPEHADEIYLVSFEMSWSPQSIYNQGLKSGFTWKRFQRTCRIHEVLSIMFVVSWTCCQFSGHPKTSEGLPQVFTTIIMYNTLSIVVTSKSVLVTMLLCLIISSLWTFLSRRGILTFQTYIYIFFCFLGGICANLFSPFYGLGVFCSFQMF